MATQTSAKGVGHAIAQLEDVIEKIDNLPKSGLRGHSLRTEAHHLAWVVQMSTGWPYNTMKALVDLKYVLGELAKSGVKSAPATTLPPAGNAGLTALTKEKTAPLGNKAQTDFDVFAPKGA